MSEGPRKQKPIVSTARAITTWQWLILLLLLPLFLFISPARSPVLLVVPLLWMVRKAAFGRFIPVTPVDLSVLLLLIMTLVSVVITYDLAFSLPKIAGVVLGIALFYAVVDRGARSTRSLWFGVALLLIAGLGVVGLGIMGADWRTKLPFLGSVLTLLPERIFSLPGSDEAFNRNEIAGVLLWIAPAALTLALGLSLRRKVLQTVRSASTRLLLLVALWVVALIQCTTILLTQSRAALLGLAGSLLLALVLLSGRHRRKLALLLALALVAASLVAWQMGTERLGELLFVQAGIDATGGAMNSLSGRREIWTRAIYGIQDFPFTGMGMNTFRQVVHVLYPLFLIAPGADIAHAHNHLLQTALDLGLPGLVAYVGIWLGMGGMLLQTWQRARRPDDRILVAAFSACLVAYFIFGLVDAVALGARPGFVFWALMGLITAQFRRVLENTQTT